MLLEDGGVGMLVVARERPSDGRNPATVRMIKALRHTGTMVSLCGVDGRPVMRNPAAIRSHGESTAVAPVRSLFEDDRSAAGMRAANESEGALRAEVRMRTRGGFRWRETCQTPVIGAAGQLLGTGGFARYITLRAEALEAPRRTSAELARSNAELERFAYVISHDLRQPPRMGHMRASLLEYSRVGRKG